VELQGPGGRGRHFETGSHRKTKNVIFITFNYHRKSV
jgi:hypothetical protein